MVDVTGEDGENMLPVIPVGQVQRDSHAAGSWLVESLWLKEACGIIGGPSKCRKTWYGLELCLAVSSGRPAFGRFKVADPGPALVFLAEDKLYDAKLRAASIGASRGVDIASLDLHLITAPSLRLDSSADRTRLSGTVKMIRPKILLLDPLIRMHSQDENSSREISEILGYLRTLQRESGTAVIVTHHANKKSHGRGGDRLRGSGDLHAWGDSNTYIFPKAGRFEATVEHRAAAAPEPFMIALEEKKDGACLEIQDDRPEEAAQGNLHNRILKYLQKSGTTVRRQDLRSGLKVKNSRLGDALGELERSGIIAHSNQGWSLLQQPLFD